VANLASDAIVIPVRRLTTSAWDRQPVWSADGKQLAFTSGGSADDSQIWIVNADGSGKRRLTAAVSKQWDTDPTWSADGQRIVFASTARAGKFDIMQVTPGGTLGPALTKGAGSNQRHPTFSSDGNWLAFSSDKFGNSEIVAASADGLNWTNVTKSASMDSQPNWGK
jgi:Tol biopolymer transport system component